MNKPFKTILAAAALSLATQASAQITFFEHDQFTGRSFTTSAEITNFQRYGFNDRASSAEVRGERWEVCEDTRFNGRCVVLRPGRYPSLAAMGLNDRVSSTRAVSSNARIDERRYAPAPIVPQITFFEGEGYSGQAFTATDEIRDLRRAGYNDRASSVEVVGERWEICDDVRLRGRCVVLRPGRYPSLFAMGLNDRVSSVRVLSPLERIDGRRYAPAPVAAPAPSVARITFFEREGFAGRSFTTEVEIANLQRYGFNDRASSVEVFGERWEICDDARFSGRCVLLRPGRYPSLAAMGLPDRVSSARMADRRERSDERRNAPPPVAAPDYRRGRDERLYEANVTSVRAVLGAQEQKCWVEREQVTVERANPGVPGAIAGAVIGGILGHQIGGGRGKDLATVGGAIAGAAAGANMTRDSGGQQVQTQDVQRCTTVPNQAKPDYWDVTYTFRGQENRVQMTTPPGSTITVNERGEPRL